jgi:hypothetical protein
MMTILGSSEKYVGLEWIKQNTEVIIEYIFSIYFLKRKQKAGSIFANCFLIYFSISLVSLKDMGSIKCTVGVKR